MRVTITLPANTISPARLRWRPTIQIDPNLRIDDALARRLVGARLAQLAALPHFSRSASISI